MSDAIDPHDDVLAAVPDTADLARGLASVLPAAELPSGGVEVLDRELNDFARTFPSEFVTYRRADGRAGELFCKYMPALPADHHDHGSRGGTEYEEIVYRRLLAPLAGQLAAAGAPVPPFRGTYRDPHTGGTWLVLDKVPGVCDLDRSDDPTAVVRAAAWAGRFHAVLERRLAAAPVPGLKRYDADFYRGWVRRTIDYAGPWFERFDWLHGLCDHFDEAIATLLAAPPTLVHGELYPHNVLVRDDAVYAVDWESATIAAGEIDLATVTEGWSPEDVVASERAYAEARWPGGAPAEFGRRLAAARQYIQFRWLGSDPEWSTAADVEWRLIELRDAGKFLGWVPAGGA